MQNLNGLHLLGNAYFGCIQQDPIILHDM